MAQSTLDNGVGDNGVGRVGLSGLIRLIARLRHRPTPLLGPPLPPGVPEPLAPLSDKASGPDSLTILQWLWGPGYVIPGGADHVLTLTRPLGLSSAMTLLDVSAGLGGPIRAIVASCNAHASGLERDPELARIGMAMSTAQGQARRAPIAVFDPESFDLKSGHYDCVLGREVVYAVREKERFLRVLRQGLKTQGQLVLTDFLIDRARGGEAVLAAWEGVQPYPPHLWTLERYVDCLKSLGFEIRLTEDMSAGYRAMIVAAWSGLLSRPELAQLPRSHFRLVLDEAERTMLTLKALDGALRMYRIYALARRSIS